MQDPWTMAMVLSRLVTMPSPSLVIEGIERLEGRVPEGHGLAALALDLGADGFVVPRLPVLATGLVLETKDKAARARIRERLTSLAPRAPWRLHVITAHGRGGHARNGRTVSSPPA